MAGPISRSSCDAVGKLLGTIMRPWTLHILWVFISKGPTRFGDLRRSVPGISARVLTVRLRALEAEGLVHRHQTASNPPEVTYGLTPRAVEMGAVLEDLQRVAVRWDGGGEPAPAHSP